MAEANAMINEKAKAKEHLARFDQSDYGKIFMARRMIAPTQMALGMYDESLATYAEIARRMAADTLNDDYAVILRSRAIAAREKKHYAEAYDYQTRYADLSKVLSDSLMKGKAHEYAARYHDQEQKLEIAQINAENQRKTIIIWAAVIIILLVSIFATWLLRQWRVIRRKNLVVTDHIYISTQNNGGIAVRTMGNNNRIQNCVSNVSIHSNRSGSGDAGDCTNGGFIGRVNINDAHVYFEGCAFTGELLGENATNWGGFVGWRELSGSTKSYVHFKDCLFAPTTISIATPKGSNSRPFCRNNNSNGAEYNNSYYTNVLQGAFGGKQAYSTAKLPANIGEAGTDYGMIAAYANGLKYGERYFMAPESVSLTDNAANSTTLSEKDGYFAEVTLSGCTLYTDGNWNTLYLPFDVVLEGSPLQGAEARTLSEATFSNGTLTLSFSAPVAELSADTPYIIRWKDGAADLVSPVFSGVTVNAAEPARITPGLAPGTEGDGCVTFCGVYDPVTIGAEGDNTKLYFSTGNTLYWPNGAMTINPFRAYLQLNSTAAQARSIVLNVGGETTAIKPMFNGQCSMVNDESWYDMSGRKLDGKPNTKGVFIHGGRKVVIK